MPANGDERRKHPRHPHFSNIHFCLNPDPHNETRLAVSVNMSDTGMCFYTFSPLATGQTIMFKDGLSLPHQKATVRWVKEYHRNFYKVGLMFHREERREDDIP